MSKGEAHIRSGQSHTDKLCDDMLEFDRIRLKELSAGRYIIEQVSHREIRATRSRHLGCRDMLRISKINLTSDLVFLSTRLERNLCDSRY